MRIRRCRIQAVLAIVAAACFSGIVGAADQVPFRAVISGDSEITNGFEDFHGAGTASHMGRTRAHMQHIVTLAIEILDGQFTFTAANGDVLCGSYSGQGEVVSELGDPLLISFEGTYTVEGGTGRFAGATGGGEITGLVSPNPTLEGASADLSFEGTISRPNAGRGEADGTCPAMLTR
jgi:hypothetical protein